LEKELFYYRKTSRELKKKLREYVSSGTIPAQGKADECGNFILVPTFL